MQDTAVRKGFQSTEGHSLISDKRDISCTFVPSIAYIGDVCLIDFPGFSDTNGDIVALGIELAIRELLRSHDM